MNNIRKNRTLAYIAGAFLLLAARSGITNATPITFTGTSGNLSASATFTVSGSNLLVTLTNTSSADVMQPPDILTGIFFDLSGNPTLGRVSAILNTGSTVLFGTTDPGNVVGGEWAYKSSLSGAPHGATQGIESSGLGLFSKFDRFPGSNLQGTDAPGGLEYGITSAGDNPLTGNTPVTGTNALIRNSVNFILSGIGAGFDPSLGVSNVSFQYGTALTEPNIVGIDPPTVPEPASLALLTLGLAGLGFTRRKQV